MLKKIYLSLFIFLILNFTSFSWECKNITFEPYWNFKNFDYVSSFGGGDLAYIFGVKIDDNGNEILAKNTYAIGKVLLRTNFVLKATIGFDVKGKAIFGVLYSDGKPFILVGVFKKGIAVKNCFYQNNQFKCKTFYYKTINLNEPENDIVISFKPIQKSDESGLYVIINKKSIYRKKMLSSESVYFRPCFKSIYSKIYIYNINVCANEIKELKD